MIFVAVVLLVLLFIIFIIVLFSFFFASIISQLLFNYSWNQQMNIIITTYLHIQDRVAIFSGPARGNRRVTKSSKGNETKRKKNRQQQQQKRGENRSFGIEILGFGMDEREKTNRKTQKIKNRPS